MSEQDAGEERYAMIATADKPQILLSPTPCRGGAAAHNTQARKANLGMIRRKYHEKPTTMTGAGLDAARTARGGVS